MSIHWNGREKGVKRERKGRKRQREVGERGRKRQREVRERERERGRARKEKRVSENHRKYKPCCHCKLRDSVAHNTVLKKCLPSSCAC